MSPERAYNRQTDVLQVTHMQMPYEKLLKHSAYNLLSAFATGFHNML